jgi:hypothetical protein
MLKKKFYLVKIPLQPSNDDSQQQSKFTLTCKHNDPNNTEPLFLCINIEDYFIILLSQNEIDKDLIYNKIVLSEDSFP